MCPCINASSYNIGKIYRDEFISSDYVIGAVVLDPTQLYLFFAATRSISL